MDSYIAKRAVIVNGKRFRRGDKITGDDAVQVEQSRALRSRVVTDVAARKENA